MFFGPGIYVVFSMLQDVVSYAENHCILRCFCFLGEEKIVKKYGSRIDICWAMLAQLTAAVRGPEKLASNLCFPPAQLRSFSALLAANTASLLAFVWHSAGPRAVSQSQNFNVAF